jgi:hypothetical protein
MPKDPRITGAQERQRRAAPYQPVGRVPLGNRIVSARLNKQQLLEDLDNIVPETAAPTDADIQELVDSLAQQGLNIQPAGAGGGKRQRGGDVWGTAAERAGFVKAIALMSVYNTAWALGEGAAAVVPPTQAYLLKELDPLIKASGRLGGILKGLIQQTTRVPITLALLSAGGLGYTANVAAKLLEAANSWGRGTSEYLLSEDAAEKAATAALSSAKQAALTGAVTAATLNQLGLLPVSTMLAAIFFALQVNLGTGTGRAYVISGFYTWYLSQERGTQETIKTEAVKYAAAAKAKAVPAAAEAARALAPHLARAGRGAAAGAGNAFKVVADALRRPPAAHTGEQPVTVSAPIAAEQEGAAPAVAEAVLVQGVSAAAVAAEAGAESRVEAADGGAPPAPVVAVVATKTRKSRKVLDPQAVPFPAPGDGAAMDADAALAAPAGPGGRRKTKKVKSKRRVTRRKKATKVLGAPVFIY